MPCRAVPEPHPLKVFCLRWKRSIAYLRRSSERGSIAGDFEMLLNSRAHGPAVSALPTPQKFCVTTEDETAMDHLLDDPTRSIEGLSQN